ncbi:MAG: glycosyltransferase family 2 protein, partial [Desulfurivibrionaceae bacterium]
PAAARNTGIRAARYPLLAFLDSDDQFTKNKLALQVAAMEAQPELLISHTQETWFRNGQHLNQKKRHSKEGGDLFARSLELCVVGMSTVMVRRELFDRVGLFDESFPCCEDYELWLRASAGHPFLLVDVPLTVKHGGREDQVSVRFKTGMDCFRIRAMEKLLSSIPLTQEQSRLARAELVRKVVLYGNGCLKHNRLEEGQHCLSLVARYS